MDRIDYCRRMLALYANCDEWFGDVCRQYWGEELRKAQASQ